MNTRIALMGAHRVGKSTLAKAVAEKHGIDYAPCSLSEVYRDLGVDVGEPVDWETRKELQLRMLSRITVDVESRKGRSFASDRCPLDLVAYTLAELPQDITKSDDRWFSDYFELCIETTKRLYDGVMYIRPGIELVRDETSWSHANGVVDKIDACMLFTAERANKKYRSLVLQLNSGVLDLNERIDHVSRMILKAQLSTAR